MNSKGSCFASARSKDGGHVAPCSEARPEHELAEQARRTLCHEQEDEKARDDVSRALHGEPSTKGGRWRWRTRDAKGVRCRGRSPEEARPDEDNSDGDEAGESVYEEKHGGISYRIEKI